MKAKSGLNSGAGLNPKTGLRSSWISVGFFAVFLLWLSITAVGQVLALNPDPDRQEPHNILQPVATTPAATQFLPRRAPLVISTQAHPDNLFYGTIGLVDRPQREALKELWADVQTYLNEHWLLDYTADVQPWIGQEITLAVTNSDLDQDPANGWQPGYLLAMQSNDTDQAKASVNNFWQRLATGGVDLAFGQAQGIPLTYVKTPDTDSGSLGQSLSSTIIGGYVLFANDPMVLRNAIQTLQVPSLGLTSWDIYQKANQNLTEPSLVTAFVNLDEVTTWRDGSIRNKSTQILDPLPSGGLGLRFHWDSQGLHAVTTLAHDETASPLVPNLIGNLIGNVIATTDHTNKTDSTPKTNRKTLSPSPFNANDFASKLATIPNHSNLWIGHNLAQTLNILTSNESDPLQQPLQKPLQDIFNQTLKPLIKNWVLPIDQSTLAWATEGYGLAVFPKDQANSVAKPNANYRQANTGDWLLIAQKTPTAKPALDSLDGSARHDARLTVGTVDFAGHPLTLWTQFNRLQPSASGTTSGSMVAGNVVAVHTEIDELVYFSNSLPVLQAALQGERNLFKQPEFTNFVTHQYHPPQTYVYLGENVDLPSLTKYLGKTWFNQSWQLPPVLTDAVSTIGFSLTNQDPQQLSGEVFFGTAQP
ncbi:MAG: DUF3352 domain-containing protein [Pseudanabaenaceae cyanobacterium]